LKNRLRPSFMAISAHQSRENTTVGYWGNPDGAIRRVLREPPHNSRQDAKESMNNKKQSIPVKPRSTDLILEKINSGVLSEKDLIALHHNAVRLVALDVVEATKLKLRAEFPRAAKKLFGAPEAETAATL